ncbi:RNA polymerase sigma factor [Paraliomyxa miuraensis]|uniref:RNA polymerase sigma factor n=1 Tax=Paraliomyxa miuraensis TaxID=376150 RepID=UPI0022553213|nr:sigma-70 family RNA polymerase sigma factor [Paraliomyxa miuraensis]MCX4247277.1 sigma-70 family RNA polymerase sigma factor [Paraliomyxa miuraensis]
MSSDVELLLAWQRGERSAGKELFERYYRVLVRFFANKVGEDSMDLIHETFLGCISGQARLRDSQSFRSYLFAIACNQLRKHYERQRRHGERFDPSTQTSADLSPGPGSILVKHAEQRLVLAALRRIPVEHQIVLELFYWEGLTSAAIAETLDEPHGTIRTRLRRARQLLDQAMAEVAEDPRIHVATHSDLEGWVAKIRATMMASDQAGGS